MIPMMTDKQEEYIRWGKIYAKDYVAQNIMIKNNDPFGIEESKLDLVIVVQRFWIRWTRIVNS